MYVLCEYIASRCLGEILCGTKLVKKLRVLAKAVLTLCWGLQIKIIRLLTYECDIPGG